MITRDDWLNALHEAVHAPLPETDALTVVELAEVFGVGREQARRRVNVLIANGRAERTRKQIRRADGGVLSVPAFRLLPEVPHATRREHTGRVRRRRSRA
jgi:hypothetical protein